jgi:hypothetical protein
MRNPKPFGKLGNRGLARLAMGLEASLALSERTVSAVVENVSREGCCLQLAEPPRSGVTAVVRIEEIEALGTVIWAKGQRCGVTFASKLSPEVVERFCWIVENFRDHEEADIASKSAMWR